MFNGDEGTFISHALADNLRLTHRNANPLGIEAQFYGKNKLMDLLNQPGCMGIRVYHGLDPANGQRVLVLVGADVNENDISTNLFLEMGAPCPPKCSQ